MTRKVNVPILIALVSACTAFAQESPTTTPPPAPEKSATPSPTPEQTPSAPPTRTVRLSFVPPPLEGTISLGIYDGSGKLVRVLHQEAELNEFTIGADALVTQWMARMMMAKIYPLENIAPGAISSAILNSKTSARGQLRPWEITQLPM